MKHLFLFSLFLWPILLTAQFEAGEKVTVNTEQKDDIYVSGEQVDVNAVVNGDLVAAAATVTINDSILQDLITAGGEILIKGPVKDDIRAAGGTLNLESEVGDDLVVFGGEVDISEQATIRGNLIAFAGEIRILGDIEGMVKVYGGEVHLEGNIAGDAELNGGEIFVNGSIGGTTKLASESLQVGEQAKFLGDVRYWTEEGEVDFKNALGNSTATFDESLEISEGEVPWKFFGLAAFGFWIFYVLSAFLVILILNRLFGRFFKVALVYVQESFLRSLGYGLLYLIGVPILVLITFALVIGIPIGLFLIVFYLFSLLFGHLVVALLLAYYLNARNGKMWNYWTIVFLALGIAIVLRLITLLPFFGPVFAILIISIAYGAIAVALFERKVILKIAE